MEEAKGGATAGVGWRDCPAMESSYVVEAYSIPKVGR
jgi:hypothetical protein